VEHLLPALAAGLCAALAWSMLRRFVARRRVHELIWGGTFVAFGLAAGAELYAGIVSWTPGLVRLYYLTGASLAVGFLALGTLVLLVPRRLAMVALAVVLVQAAFMVFLVLRSPVDPAAAQVAGWSALTKDGSLRALALTINVLGTLIVLIGTFGSAYAQWVSGHGSRAFGVLLIGVGTLVIATGGSLTRFGHHLLYGPMVPGLLLIYAGYHRVTSGGGRRSSGTAPPENTAGPVRDTGAPETAESGVGAADGTIRTDEVGSETWQSHLKR
jgi:hypothetical protein